MAYDCEQKPPPTDAPAGTADQVKTIVRRLGPVGPLAIIAAGLPALGGFLLLGTFTWLGPWLQARGTLGVTLYGVGFALTSGLAVLPTYAQSALGGWAFGAGLGLPAALGGCAGGALVGYVIARRASGDRVVEIIGEHPKWKAVYDALLGGDVWKTLLIVTLLRLPPNSPFAITNLVLAATRVPLWIYLPATVLGIAPRTGVAVFAAAGLSQLDLQQARQTWVLVAGIAITIVVLVIIGYIGNKAIAKVTRVPEAGVTEDSDRTRPADRLQS